MSDLKPIETGCMAIIIGGERGAYAGMQVRVGAFLGELEGWAGKRRWAIDKSLKSRYGDQVNHRQECNLLRIDGHDEKEVTKELELTQ